MVPLFLTFYRIVIFSKLLVYSTSLYMFLFTIMQVWHHYFSHLLILLYFRAYMYVVYYCTCIFRLLCRYGTIIFNTLYFWCIFVSTSMQYMFVHCLEQNYVGLAPLFFTLLIMVFFRGHMYVVQYCMHILSQIDRCGTIILYMSIYFVIFESTCMQYIFVGICHHNLIFVLTLFLLCFKAIIYYLIKYYYTMFYEIYVLSNK